MRAAAAIFLLSGMLSAAEAQGLSGLAEALKAAVALKTCAELKDDKQRLTCYDEIAKGALAPAVASPPKWTLHRETSKFDDTETVAASIKALDGGSEQLWIYCQRKRLMVAVSVGFVLKERPMASIFYRLDKEKPHEDVVRVAEDATTFFWQDEGHGRRFLERLLKGNTVAFRAADYQGGMREFAFDLTGIREGIAPIDQACIK